MHVLAPMQQNVKTMSWENMLGNGQDETFATNQIVYLGVEAARAA